MENSTLLLRPASWTRSAACAGRVTPGSDPWHPADELSSNARATLYATARVVCAGCPVRHPCAVDALQAAVAHGMYGGLTPGERREVARRFGYPMPGAARHGTRSCYVTGCRRPECTEAHRRYIAEQRARGPRPSQRRRSRTRDVRKLVLAAVKAASGPVTARAVYRATGVKVGRVREIVRAAEDAGQLVPGLVA